MTMSDVKLIRCCFRVFIVIYIFFHSDVTYAAIDIITKQETTMGGDFLCYYVASHQLLSGDPAGIYNVKSFLAAQQQITGRAYTEIIRWFYPPTYLLFVAWLATLPYVLSFYAWLAVTMAGYVLTVCKIAPRPLTMWLVLAYPGTFVNIVYGQNGFLSATLLGLGLWLLERRPVWAGIILGLLVIKPQLVFLVVIALAAAGKWRALLAAGATAAALNGASIAMFGAESWAAFYHTLPVAKQWLETGVLPWRQMISLFAQARLWGASIPLAYALQAALTAVTVAAVAWVWYKRVFPLAYIVLAVGTLLATPFAYDYDLTILGLAIAWYGWEGLNNGWLSGEKAVLALAWLMPLLGLPVAYLINIKPVFIILAALLVLTCRRLYVLGEGCGSAPESLVQKPATGVCADLGGDD